MKQNNFWRFVLVILVILWSLYEIIPPTSKDLIVFFRKNVDGHQRDAAFNTIMTKVADLQKVAPEKAYDNLVEAIGTNDITRYFPNFNAKNETHPTTYILNRLQRQAAGRIHLGLDLQGGVSFVVEMQTNFLNAASADTNRLSAGSDTNRLNASFDTSAAISHAVEVLRKRVDKLGVAEPLLQPQGSDRILIQMPGLSAATMEIAKQQIQKAAYLEFRLVHPQSDDLASKGVAEPGYEILKMKRKEKNGAETTVPVLVRKRSEMDGSGLTDARVHHDDLGKPEIAFSLNSDGAHRFGQITRENVGRRLAIILDGELYSDPRINEPIESGSGQITGQFDEQEAQQLAYALQNPLRAPLKIVQSTEVGPTLGRDSIRSGIKASIYGTLAVSVFMLVYYLIAGMVANIALLANIVILLGVMCSIGTTLTLPGIAGVVLTVGMAVDANVLIYERIREETAKGKSLRGAISAGYARAFGTIFDSHVTTLISSVILIFMGTGTIKGFGMALTIGVAASLFTALVVTRMIFDFLLDRGWLKSINMLHFIRATKLDFMKLAKPAFAISWFLILIGISYGVYRGPKSLFSPDFRGGETSIFEFQQRPDENAVREALARAGVPDPTIQFETETDPFAKKHETLHVVSPENKGDDVRKALESLPGAGLHRIGHDLVGATVGQEIQRTAIIASLLSLFGILIYVAVRYEFSFAVGAVLAVIHDVLMTIGWYCLSGRQFDVTTVAAILTIIGFSTNDTIVIFDRIREDLKLGVRGTFKEVMNQALNQTLSRTIITSGTVFLATFSLYLFGGGAINAFAFTFLIGIITGTYSSIYIASALVLFWHKGHRPNIGSGPHAPIENVAAATR